MSKPAVKSLLLLLAAVVAYYWRIVFTRRFSMVTDSETVSQAYSWFHFWAESIRHGVWPLWDPYAFAGRSYAGEMQMAAFYPLHLVFAPFGPDRYGLLSERLYHDYFVFAHVIAAVAMFALIRELELGYFAAVVGGLCFSVGGFMGQVPWPHLLESASWTPLLLLLLLRAAKATDFRRGVVYASLTGLVLGMSILAGGLHVVFMQAILLAAAGVYQAFVQGRAGVHWARPLALVGVAFVIGLAAGAVQLAPSIEYSARAMRFVNGGALPATEKIPYANLDAVPPRVLANYLFFSNPQGTMDGREVLDPYFGAFPLLLAAIGFWKCRRNRWVPFAAGLVVIAFLYSLGRSTWFYGIVYVVVPYLWMAREASRFLFLAHFGLVILAAFGCDHLFSVPQKLADWRILNRIFLFVFAGCALALAVPAIQGTRRTSLWMILLAYPLFRWIAGGATGIAPRLLTVALIVVNLTAFSFVSPDKREVARSGTNFSERLRGLRGVADFLRRQPGPFRVRVLADPPLNLGDAYGIETLNGGAVTLSNAFFDLMNKTANGPHLLNARYVIRPAAAAEPNPVYADRDWKVYEDPQAMPRAWVQNIEPSAAVLPQPATVTAYTARRIELTAYASTRGLLVLSELYYPGWQARVNGASVAINEVDGGLRGVEVPSGDSTVTFDYSPVSVWAGAALSGLTFLAVLLGSFAIRA
jgi:hypothetical protein